MPYGPMDATQATVAANRDAVRLYDLDDGKDFESARRNLISARMARLRSILRCTPISAMT